MGWGQHMGSGGVSIWGGEGVSGGNGILSISNRMAGCVCNITMPSVDTVTVYIIVKIGSSSQR